MTRGRILASGTAVVLVVVGVFVIASGSDAGAQVKTKEPPLDTKGDASARPWKRYSGWPERDESQMEHTRSCNIARRAEGTAQTRRPGFW